MNNNSWLGIYNNNNLKILKNHFQPSIYRFSGFLAFCNSKLNIFQVCLTVSWTNLMGNCDFHCFLTLYILNNYPLTEKKCFCPLCPSCHCHTVNELHYTTLQSFLEVFYLDSSRTQPNFNSKQTFLAGAYLQAMRQSPCPR